VYYPSLIEALLPYLRPDGLLAALKAAQVDNGVVKVQDLVRRASPRHLLSSKLLPPSMCLGSATSFNVCSVSDLVWLLDQMDSAEVIDLAAAAVAKFILRTNDVALWQKVAADELDPCFGLYLCFIHVVLSLPHRARLA